MEEKELTYGERMKGDEFFKETCKYTEFDTGRGYSNIKTGCRIELGSFSKGWCYCPYCGKEIEVER